jgi:hypothetical protein
MNSGPIGSVTVSRRMRSIDDASPLERRQKAFVFRPPWFWPRSCASRNDNRLPLHETMPWFASRWRGVYAEKSPPGHHCRQARLTGFDQMKSRACWASPVFATELAAWKDRARAAAGVAFAAFTGKAARQRRLPRRWMCHPSIDTSGS